ncbi:MAG TPA: MOSC N-terminal beta barrel domain-containing protein [Dehalococcoidia bacterium]|nr:MOSC N-terminal beta barrel domain-containing protein [Dehalococcoidia bacterium]
MSNGEQAIGVVESLWRYPVKSMLGEELSQAVVTERGLAGDRAYAVVEPSEGKVGSVKIARKWGRLFEFSASYVEPPRPGERTPPVRIEFPDGTALTSEAADLDRRLSAVLRREVRLASEPPPGLKIELTRRGADPLDPEATTVDVVLPNPFFDLAALHVVSTASLERLRELYPQGRWEARRFRLNLLVRTDSGQSGFVENGWVGKTLAIGDEVRIRVISPTVRCAMPTLPQGDLPPDPGILRTAAQANQSNVGAYAMVVRGGVVRVGDGVRVVDSG